jgi:peptidoglycan/xylan/chitin deacetylase (PgdA/CDA1 family)
MLKNKGYKIIQWDVITYDWNSDHTPEKILNTIKQYTRNGSIIVMHDSEKAAPRVLEALEDIIIWLKQEGYKLTTLT